MRLTISVPGNVPIEVINAALAQFGAVVKLKKTRKAEAKPGPDFEPVLALDKDGNVIREIDGVSVQKAIRKIMAEVNRRSDPHAGVNFGHLSKHVPDDMIAADYMNNFCRAKSHVPALYSNGVTA